jgi:hypothetical protein
VSTPYKKYYSIFYKGLYGAHWVYDREHFAVTVGFNKGTLLYDGGSWTKVKPGAYPSAFFGRHDAGNLELWCLGTSKMIVSSWDKLLGRAGRTRNEPIGDAEYLSDFCVVDGTAIAVGDDGKVFRRTAPVTNPNGTWTLDATLKPIESLVAIDARSTGDIWIAGRSSAWHWSGKKWKRVKLPKRERAIDVVCGPKNDVYICGGETLVRIRGSRVERFDAPGCDFQTVAIYEGELYLNVADTDDDAFIGIWTLRRNKLERVSTGFPPGWEYQPGGQLEVREGLLWSFGNFGVYVFDGKRWTQLPNPKV